MNFLGSRGLIALDVRDFEEALVDPRAVDSQHPHLLRDFLGLIEPIQTHVGVQLAPMRWFDVWLYLSRCLTFLEPLFELPQVYVGLLKLL